MKAMLQSRRTDDLLSRSTWSRGQGIAVADAEDHEMSELQMEGWSGPFWEGGGLTCARCIRDPDVVWSGDLEASLQAHCPGLQT